MQPLSLKPSVNGLAAPLVDALAAEAAMLRLAVSHVPDAPRLINSGARARGSCEAGCRFS